MEKQKSWLRYFLDLFKPMENEVDDRIYKYKYRPHPFENWFYFSVEANSQEEANELAKIEYLAMLERRETATLLFWPV